MAEPLSLARHIFLTGEKQVGKSTLWQRLIARQQLRCAGFETRLLMLEGQRRGFILHGRVDMDPASNDCIVSVRTGPRKSVPVLDVFNENGVEILRRSLDSDAPFLLMDELGQAGAPGGSLLQPSASGVWTAKSAYWAYCSSATARWWRKLPPVQTLRCYG